MPTTSPPDATPAADLTALNYDAILDDAETIARQAGALLRQYFERPRQAQPKTTVIDLTTEADAASEALIVAALRDRYPDHHIHGEEGGGYGPAPDTAAHHWWVDPLDATTNFAHRFPVFSVSIALADADLNPILGVVYNPMLDELFKAQRGVGAWLNGRRLRVSATPDLAGALVVTGFPYDRWTASDNNVDHFGNFVVRTQGVRRVGSAALDLCYVAAGRCDGYWERGPYPWDVQAGLLCVLEAGGRVTDYDGAYSRAARSGRPILATNGHIHAQMLAVLQRGADAPRPAEG